MRPAELQAAAAELRDLLDDLLLGPRVFAYNDGLNEPAGRLQVAAPALLAEARRAVRDGYPTRSGHEPGGAATVVDEHGAPMPPLSDPVGELAASDPEADPLYRRARAVEDGVNGALDWLRSAVHALALAQPPPPKGDEIEACRSHGRLKSWVPADHADGLCGWCHAWKLAHGGEWPWPELVQDRIDGRRITVGRVLEVGRLREFAPPKRRAGKRARAS